MKLNPNPDLLAAAATAVSAAEALPLAESGGLSLNVMAGPAVSAINAARDAVEALRADTVQCLCPPRLQPVSAATLADLAMAYTTIPAYEAAVATLVDLHEAAVEDHTELAEALRGPRGLRFVALRAVERSGGQPGAAESAVKAYVDGIAPQLARRQAHPLHAVATILVRDVPTLNARIDAVAERHRQHAEAEAERARQAAERADQAARSTAAAAEAKRRRERLRNETDAERQRRRELEGFFARHGNQYRFTIDGVEMDGTAAAGALAEGAEFRPFWIAQHHGVFVRRPGPMAAAV